MPLQGGTENAEMLQLGRQDCQLGRHLRTMFLGTKSGHFLVRGARFRTSAIFAKILLEIQITSAQVVRNSAQDGSKSR